MASLIGGAGGISFHVMVETLQTFGSADHYPVSDEYTANGLASIR